MATHGSNDSSDKEIKKSEAISSQKKSGQDPTAPEQNVLIHVINVGQGDSILVELGEYNTP